MNLGERVLYRGIECIILHIYPNEYFEIKLTAYPATVELVHKSEISLL